MKKQLFDRSEDKEETTTSVDLSIKIKSGNAAFGDGNAAAETARILRDIAGRIERLGVSGGNCTDANGNTVGSWAYDETEE